MVMHMVVCTLNSAMHFLKVLLVFICILYMMRACIPQVNDSECNLLELSPVNGYTVRAYAVFDGPTLTGRITFVRACEHT